MQGGGIHIDGSADLTDCNIHDNRAVGTWPDGVSFLHQPSAYTALQLEHHACTCFWQYGAGLYIMGTATLTDTKVYENQAGEVCSPVEPSS